MSGSDSLASSALLLSLSVGLPVAGRGPPYIPAQEQPGPPKSLMLLSTHPTLFVDPGRPSAHSPWRALCVGFPSVNLVLSVAKGRSPSALTALTRLYQASGSAVSLAGCVVPCVRFNDVVRQPIPDILCPCSPGSSGSLVSLPRRRGFLSATVTPQTGLGSSFIAATLGTGGWLVLTRWGLAPHKKHQVSLAHQRQRAQPRRHRRRRLERVVSPLAQVGKTPISAIKGKGPLYASSAIS